MSDQGTKDLQTLTSMFPGIDAEVCEAVLNANNGDMGTSITSLLTMSDPNFEGEEVIPIQTEDGLVTSSSRLQIERDEELARQLAAEDNREHGPPSRPVNQQPQQQQQQSSSGFSDLSEELQLPVIKEKIVQAADTTKKKVKEWYDKIRQPRDEPGQPLYTNLPGDEADNPILDEDFLNTRNRHQDVSSLRSRTDYESRNTDVINNEPIKIIRNDQNNNSLINGSSEKEINKEEVTPYRLLDEATDESTQTNRTEESSTGRHDTNEI